MPLHKNCLSAIANNESLAFCSSDGVLHVWDVKTGEQKQQYLPSSHLSAMFTCLAWKPGSSSNHLDVCSPKKKSHRSKAQHAQPNEYIALGTAVGDIVLFNALNGELVSKFKAGHSDQVNCITWGKDNTFYSCSSDQHIVEWNASNPTHKDKWKAEKREVFSISVGPLSKTILSGGKLIKLWDLKTKQLLRKYAGHTAAVFSLSYLNISSMLSTHGDSFLDILDGSYFLSAALDDRALSVWQIKSQKHKKTATCSFALPSEPCMFDVLPPQTQDKPSLILAVTEDDQIVIFSHVLNGLLKKPLMQSRSIKVVTDDASPIKVICASFKKDNRDHGVTVTLAYGSSARVAFEQINLNDHTDSDIVLIRKDPSKSEVYLEQDKLKLKEPIKNKKVSSIVPGVIEHSGEKMSAKKRKKQPSIGEAQERHQPASIGGAHKVWREAGGTFTMRGQFRRGRALCYGAQVVQKLEHRNRKAEKRNHAMFEALSSVIDGNLDIDLSSKILAHLMNLREEFLMYFPETPYTDLELLTVEERLQVLSVDVLPSSNDPPKADSFSVLLSQGLQSDDRDVLNQVLQHGNETLIRNTVRQLPITFVIPLVKELTDRMQGGPEKCLIFIKWMKATLSCHSSYLMTFPDIIPLLSRLYQLMNVRTQTHTRLAKLEGKLEMIMSQVVTRQDHTFAGNTDQKEALFVFEEDSSDEQEDMEGITVDHPDSLDEWDELSDSGDKRHLKEGDELSSSGDEGMLDEG